VLSGVQYCKADGSGYTECICPVRRMEFQPHVVQLDHRVNGTVEKAEDGTLRFPLAGNEALASLQPREYVVSLAAGRAGRIVHVAVQDGDIVIETEPRPLGEVFDDLKIDLDSQVQMTAHLPEDQRQRWLELTPGSQIVSPLGGVFKKKGTESSTTEIAGTSFTFDGGLIPKVIDVDPATYVHITPNLYAKLDLRGFHFAFVASLDIDLMLKLRAAFEAWVKATAEIEMVELTACVLFPFACCDINCAPLRLSVTGAVSVWFWLTLGCQAEVDGSVDMSPELSFQGSYAGGVLYSDDWNDPIWDGASSKLKDAMADYAEGEVVTYSSHESEGSAQLNIPFKWTLHGGIKCYIRPKLELSILEMGGPYIEGGPYVSLDAYVERNQVEFSVGVSAKAGAELNPFGQESLFDWNHDLFDESQVIWRYSWMTCGDGMRQTHCPGHEFLPCDDCPDDDGCDNPPEECDAGPLFKQDGQGLGYEDGVAYPCIPPPGPGACTCAEGYVPAEHLDVANWEEFPDLHRGFWGDGNNRCVPACGNGEEDPGEACDPGKDRVVEDHSVEPSLNACVYECAEDCSRVVNRCGDGIKECWEECDDGNRDDCDGCSRWCLVEDFVNACGDGRVCPPEVCDDGNTVSGDGCSADCLSREGCPNGVLDLDEECDDGNLENGDGCDNNCTVSRCGNLVVDHAGGEECDDGNQDDCDACSNSCTRNPGYDVDPTKRRCDNNGVRCPWEACDDGNLSDDDQCSTLCTEILGCGDGIRSPSRGEQCDWGARNNDCGCLLGEFQCGSGECISGDLLCDQSPDCSDQSDETRCGGCGSGEFPCDNGHCISAAKLCNRVDNCGDDSDELACNGCSTDCQRWAAPSYCGDGRVCGTEECDPNDGSGSFTSCGACHIDCTLNTGCGDGHVCGEEVCDDGNNVDGDGCSADCRSDETCGNGIVDPGEACDDGNRQNGDGCRSDCSGLEVCGDKVKDPGSERCEDTSVNGVDVGCSEAAPHCSADCQSCGAKCGDGIIGTGEICEPAEGSPDPGCSGSTPKCGPACHTCIADCDNPVCGDGTLCAGEQCDDGNTTDCDGCNSDCTLTRCGDGLVCGDEVCDDGNAIGGDGCRGDCRGREICGDGLVDYHAGEYCEDTSAQGVDEGCTDSHPHCNGDRCAGCLSNLCGNGQIENPEACDGDSRQCIEAATGYEGLQDCQTNCLGWQDCVPAEYCGDGVVNGFEECDDGNNVDCDGCHSDCRAETGCGDAMVCGAEECDDGNTTDCDGCHADCRVESGCGDGVRCGVEICDDGNQQDCVGSCAADCSTVRAEPHCGDQLLDTQCGEVCEDTSPDGLDLGCTPAAPHCLGCQGCGNAVCGDGIVTPPETCDDGGLCYDSAVTCTTLTWTTDCTEPHANGCYPTDCDGCSATCQIEVIVCGDGIQQCDEECDDGNTVAGDGCDASCRIE